MALGIDFRIHRLSVSGVENSGRLCGVGPSGNMDNYDDARSYNVAYGFRPVFLLSSDILISSGDGSEGNPYIIE